MAVDLTADPKQILLDQINLQNAHHLPRTLLLADAVFADPEAYGGIENGYNTVIPFGTIHPEVFGQGTVALKYTRIDVSTTIAPQRAPLAEDSTAVNVSDLLDDLNTEYAIYLQASDIIDRPIDTTGPLVTATINVKPTSMMYTGNLILTLGDQADMGKSLTGTSLPGLIRPDGSAQPGDHRPASSTNWSDPANPGVLLLRLGAFTLDMPDNGTQGTGVGLVLPQTSINYQTNNIFPSGDFGEVEGGLAADAGLIADIEFVESEGAYLATISFKSGTTYLYTDRHVELVDTNGVTVWSGQSDAAAPGTFYDAPFGIAPGKYALVIYPAGSGGTGQGN